MEKEQYLTYWDLKNILDYAEEIRKYCFEGKEKEANNVIKEVLVNYGVILELVPETCNILFKVKF